MTPGAATPAYTLSYAAQRRVLLMNVGVALNERIYLDGYRSAQGCIASLGPSSLIVDLSRVSDFDLPHAFLMRIGEMDPAIPPPGERCVVAPQPAIFGAVRVVQTVRSFGTAPIRLFRDIGAAYATLGVSAHDFAPIALG